MIFLYDYAEYLLEYVNKNIKILFDYLSISDNDKYIELAFTEPYYITDFVKYNNLSDYFQDDDLQEIEILFSQVESGDIPEYEFMDKITDQMRIDYGIYIEHRIGNELLPTPFFFDSPSIIKTQWLIHLTNNAYEIWDSGFNVGTVDIQYLGLTTNTKNEYKTGGYNFAYTIDDFMKYGDTGTHKHNFRYGDEAVIFMSSGVRAYHNGDDEYQTIFWGSDAKHIIMLEYGEIEHGENEGTDCWFIESNKTHKRLVEKENIKELIDWVNSHYQQYRKHIER